MKNIFFILFTILIYLLTSCGSSKIFEDPQVSLHPHALDSLIHGKFIYLTVDSTYTLKLKFDTGATHTLVYDIKEIGGNAILNQKNYKVIEGRGATSKISVIAYQSKSLNSKILNAFGQDITVLSKPKQNYLQCFSELFAYDGLFGMDSFFEAQDQKTLMLDYKNNLIKILPDSYEIPHDYRKVKVWYETNSLYLEGKVNGEKMYFLFDTGFNGFIALSENVFEENESIQSKEMGKSMTTTVNDSFIPEKALTFQNVDVNIKGIPIKENIVNVVEEFSQEAIVGLSFIKNYNWIFDFEREKLYAKKIKDFDSDNYFKTLKSVQYFAFDYNGQLMVVYSNGEKYQVGDIIKSVNGKEVTDENICSILKLLAENRESWADLNVVVK